MKKYISLALVFVVVLLITAMIIRGSNDSEKVFDGFVQQVEQNDTPLSSNPIGQLRPGLEIPCYDFVVNEQIMAKRGYTVSFNPNTKLPNWVAYELTADETDGPWTRKGLRFIPDPYCKGEQADREDYRNSGYSHGHLAPAGDMKWDSLAVIESFYYTNCIPQDANLNRYSLIFDWFFTRIGRGDLLGMATEVSENRAETTRSNSVEAFSTSPPRLAATTLFQVR